MKKTKLIMPIIGISALGASLVPLTTLTSCNKSDYKVVVTKVSKDQNLYANTKVLNLFFKQNNTNNVEKTKVEIVNLKIDDVEASVVSGLTKIAVDSLGGIRVTFDIATMYSHYSNPKTIKFNLLFSNQANNTSYTVTDITLTINQEKEVENPFASESGVITGFTENLGQYAQADYPRAYPDVFVAVTLPVAKSVPQPSPYTEEETPVEEDTSNLYYKMVIPKSFTAIDDNAFYDEDSEKSTLPTSIKFLDFAPNSQMKSIGEYAFCQAESLIFVTLPSSIETLGEYCFADTINLMSMQFAPTSTHALTLPVGFLAGSTIPYIKLPNYINKIESRQETNDITPCIESLAQYLYVDFSDWSPLQIEALAKDYLGNKSIVNNNNLYCIASSPLLASAVIECFKNHGIAFKNQLADAVPYVFELSEGTTSRLWIGGMEQEQETMQQVFIGIIKNISSVPISIFGMKFPLFKFELPNFYWDPVKQQTYTIDQISATSCGSETPVSKLTAKYISSLVLPCGLARFEERNFIENTYLWQVYIPSTVESMPAASLAMNTRLNDIVYNGTTTQWKNIQKETTSHPWNEGISSITVHCTDGDVTETWQE